MDNYHSFLPKLGHTRCYWALLSADLQFIYLDPVLTYHLDAQAELLVGKSLLSFVHPDEQASAKTDLRGVLESRTLHGSVTRVRFSRLSKVRRQLGYQGPPTPWSDAEKIAVDANYMAVDIVINWAAEGLVLCFIHATVDLDPQSDNDELHKSHWTNWCGTPLMPADQIQLLFRRLLICVPQSPSGSHTRIFQILANQPGRQLLLSWPPDQGNGPTGREFAKLVENAEMGSGTQKGNDAKTSCTRRYRATQLMSPSFGEVESIFIPHGTVIFACHKVESSIRSTPTTPVNMQHHLTYNANNGSGYPPPPGSSYYDSPPSYPPLVPPYNHGYLSHQPLPPPPPPPSHAYPPSRWSPVQQHNYPPLPPPPVQQWSTPSPTHPVSPIQPNPTSVSMDNSHLRSASYSSAPGPSWQPSPASYEVYRTASPSYGSYSGPPRTNAAANHANRGILPATSALLNTNTAVQDIVPPPKRRVSPGTARIGDQHNVQATGSGSGRGSGNRPLGIQQCSSCGATTSPEWRKGPSGKKELCNACGLRYARSRAKKDGGAPTQTHNRKKKTDKTDDRHHIAGGNRGGGGGMEVKREMRQKDRMGAGVVMTPPLATIAAAGGSSGYASTIMRRSLGSGSDYGASGTSPGGSISGSEGGSHGHAHYVTLAAGGGGASSGVNRGGSVLTPSPSPPASASVTSTSGSLALPLPVSSPNASTVTATHPQTDTTSHDIGFVHYNPASHERTIPPLTVHPHSPHTTQPPHPHSPHSALSPGGHYVHSAYTARPSPLSQVGNIVTGPAAGPLTPLSGLRSAKDGEAGAGNAMQLPPLAYMDRVTGSNQTNDYDHGSLGMGAKPEYIGDGFSHSNGNGMQGGSGAGGSGGSGPGIGREPLTPLSAESPIGPGAAGASHGGNNRGGGRSILSGQ